MGMMDRLVGAAIASKLDTYAKDHKPPADYPKADLKKLEAIAQRTADKLPGIAKDLVDVLPTKLPAASGLSDEARTAAAKIGEHLVDLVPVRFNDELDTARADTSFDYDDARAKFGQVRSALKAAPHYKSSLPDAIVAFAADKGVTPDELTAFEKRLDDVHAMLPLIQVADTDIEKRLIKLEALLGGDA
jgi:hypothetical protein